MIYICILDTQEAPKSLSLDDLSDLSSLEGSDNESDGRVTPPPPPPPKKNPKPNIFTVGKWQKWKFYENRSCEVNFCLRMVRVIPKCL